MKVERVSYDVITPSAARGIVEAIYWKPEIRWFIDRLHVLNPIRFTSMRRNEVGTKIPSRSAASAMKTGRGCLGLYVESERQQRSALLLRDVAYAIDAHFEIRGGEANEAKHLDMFTRRARTGQCFTRPYLGCREFAAHFELLTGREALTSGHPSLVGTRDLGWMLHDIDYSSGGKPRFFRAVMTDGVIEVPRFERVQASG